MFEFTEGNECFWPVGLPRVNDAGEVETCQVLIRYRIYTRTELAQQRRDTVREAAKRYQDAGTNHGDASRVEQALAELDAAHAARASEVRDRVTGWKGIARGGEEIGFDLGVLDHLLDNEARFEALRDGLYEASRGARAKN